MASCLSFADPTKKVSPEDFELLSVLGTGGESRAMSLVDIACTLLQWPEGRGRHALDLMAR